MSPSLDEAAAELYAVEPGRFTAERTRLTGEARTAGDADTAKVIGELRRPTTSAWLVNQLVRGEQGAAEEVRQLDQLGHDLREAQAALDAARMRELTKQRHQLVGALVRRADDVAAEAGQKVSAAVRRELEDTLGAAVADEQASLAVMSGRLTRALTYAGFGEVDITEATATPLSSVRPFKAMKRSDSKLAPKVEARSGQPAEHSAHRATEPAKAENPGKSPGKNPAEKQAEKLAARRTQAEELVRQARADVDTAQEALRLKERELDEAASAQAELQTRLDALQAEVITVRRELDASDRQVSHTERDVQRHERQLKDSARALTRAEAALDRLDPP